jgi:peptide/nickel transport system permease protein
VGVVVLSRSFQVLIVIVGVSLVVFTSLHLCGDPLLLMVPCDAPQEVVAPPHTHLDRERALWESCLRALGGAMAQDFGGSLQRNRASLTLVWERLKTLLTAFDAARP